MPGPPPPPPMPGVGSGPPAPPPPPSAGGGSTKDSIPSRPPQSAAKDRGALFGDIEKGKRLKKAVTNDRSKPIIAKDSNTSSGPPGAGAPPVPTLAPASSGGNRARASSDTPRPGAAESTTGTAGAPQLGGILAGGIPKLRKTGGGVDTGAGRDSAHLSDSESSRPSTTRPPIAPAPKPPATNRSVTAAPPVPMSNPTVSGLKNNLRPTSLLNTSASEISASKPKPAPPVGRKPPVPPPTSRKPSATTAPPPPPSSAPSPPPSAPPVPHSAPKPLPPVRSTPPPPPLTVSNTSSVPAEQLKRNGVPTPTATSASTRPPPPPGTASIPPTAPGSLPPPPPMASAPKAPTGAPPPPSTPPTRTQDRESHPGPHETEYTSSNGLPNDEGSANKGAINPIHDSRWRFQDDTQLPKPRAFSGMPKRYRAGRVSTVPLNLQALS